MRQVTGYDLFRSQEQERLKRDTATVFRLVLHMPQIAAKWKALDTDGREAYKVRAQACARVPVKTRKRKSTETPLNGGKRAKRKPRDPTLPKKPRSAFILFSSARRVTLLGEQPDLKPTDCLKQLGKEWQQLQDREQYQTLATVDKTRYTTEMQAWVPTEDIDIVAP
jgi:hypothetical protein